MFRELVKLLCVLCIVGTLFFPFWAGVLWYAALVFFLSHFFFEKPVKTNNANEEKML